MNKNTDEVKAMSYSCSESQPGTGHGLCGVSALSFGYNFLWPEQFLKQ